MKSNPVLCNWGHGISTINTFEIPIPNDDNEIIEVDTDNAYLHPFYTVIQAAEGCNTLRIKNENTVEFPFEAYVRPCEGVVEEEKAKFNYGGPYF